MIKPNTQKKRRLLRAARTRYQQKRLGATRLVVHMSGKHTYAQIISPEATVLFSASTVDKEVRAQYLKNGGNIPAAKDIGARLVQKVQAKGGELGKISFDRGGMRYCGRVKALAEAARAGGLLF